MDLFIHYFIPALCLILIATTPLYITRVIMYFRREHFKLEEQTVREGMYIHGILYFAFIITSIILRNQLAGLGIYLIICLLLILLVLASVYRYKFVHKKRHKYTVFFSKWNNREKWQKLLDDKKLKDVDITDGAFSFVSQIKFSYMEDADIHALMKEFKQNKDLLHSLNTRKAYLLLALHVAMTTISMVSFVLLFVLLGTL